MPLTDSFSRDCAGQIAPINDDVAIEHLAGLSSAETNDLAQGHAGTAKLVSACAGCHPWGKCFEERSGRRHAEGKAFFDLLSSTVRDKH